VRDLERLAGRRGAADPHRGDTVGGGRLDVDRRLPVGGDGEQRVQRALQEPAIGTYPEPLVDGQRRVDPELAHHGVQDLPDTDRVDLERNTVHPEALGEEVILHQEP